MDEWTSSILLNVYGYDNHFYGNTDSSCVFDWLPPNSLAINFVNTSTPPKPRSFVDLDCERLDNDLVAPTKGLLLHQRYPLRPPHLPSHTPRS